MNRQIWINFLALLPSTSVTILIIGIAFLRFYDSQDFEFLGFITQTRLWSNRLTVAAFLATLANFGVEWNRRNRETNRLAEEEQRRSEEEQRRAERERIEDARRAERRDQEARRVRIKARCRVAEIRFQLSPNDIYRQALMEALSLLEEYSS